MKLIDVITLLVTVSLVPETYAIDCKGLFRLTKTQSEPFGYCWMYRDHEPIHRALSQCHSNIKGLLPAIDTTEKAEKLAGFINQELSRIKRGAWGEWRQGHFTSGRDNGTTVWISQAHSKGRDMIWNESNTKVDYEAIEQGSPRFVDGGTCTVFSSLLKTWRFMDCNVANLLEKLGPKFGLYTVCEGHDTSDNEFTATIETQTGPPDAVPTYDVEKFGGNPNAHQADEALTCQGFSFKKNKPWSAPFGYCWSYYPTSNSFKWELKSCYEWKNGRIPMINTRKKAEKFAGFIDYEVSMYRGGQMGPFWREKMVSQFNGTYVWLPAAHSVGQNMVWNGTETNVDYTAHEKGTPRFVEGETCTLFSSLTKTWRFVDCFFGGDPAMVCEDRFQRIKTTEKPKVTTEKPKVTTEKPIATTEKPKVTTEKPKVTTEKPIATTEKPIATTPTDERSNISDCDCD